MDKKFTITIDERLQGKTVKEILRREYRCSASILTELKQKENGILLSKKPVFVTQRVNVGDVLSVWIKDEGSTMEATEIPLTILYEDEDIIAINKPREMPTHPSPKHYGDTLANGLMYYFKGERFTFRAITRLDKDTSGVVLVAKNPLSAAILVEDMKNGKIEKEYMAITNGAPNPPKGKIIAPIARKENSILLREVSKMGKEAITEYETVKEENGLALVKLHPITGRTHQLRVHLSHIGTPIYGDDLYGAPQKGEKTRLHCSSISFTHPDTRVLMKLQAPISEDMDV